jgi:hypothetical protein
MTVRKPDPLAGGGKEREMRINGRGEKGEGREMEGREGVHPMFMREGPVASLAAIVSKYKVLNLSSPMYTTHNSIPS